MGLDMSLFKRKKVVNTEVVDWREANQIRAWFVNHGYGCDDNCVDFLVSKEMLEELVADCMKVLAHPEKASEIMPTSEGFLFGDTDYDEWYFDQLRETIDQVEQVLKDTDWGTEEIFYYEWW